MFLRSDCYTNLWKLPTRNVDRHKVQLYFIGNLTWEILYKLKENNFYANFVKRTTIIIFISLGSSTV